MPACIICKARNAQFVIPKNEDVRKKWVVALGVCSQPSQGSRICFNHFDPDDIVVPNSDRCRLKPGAIPKFQGNYLKENNDHNYSKLHVDKRAEVLSLLIAMIPILMCFIPLLLVIFYSWESTDFFSGKYNLYIKLNFGNITSSICNIPPTELLASVLFEG